MRGPLSNFRTACGAPPSAPIDPLLRNREIHFCLHNQPGLSNNGYINSLNQHMKTQSPYRTGRRLAAVFNLILCFCRPSIQAAPAAPLVKGVEWQPLAAQVERLFEAMDYLGSPVAGEIKTAFDELQQGKGD